MPRPRKCRCGCGLPIPDGNTLRKAATVECAIRLTKQAQERVARKLAAEQRRQTRADKLRIKTRSQWMRDAQQAFNAWVRARDEHLPCISCGRFHKGSYDAGHYRTAGACPELRFEPDNCHRQCVPCNQHLSGNLIAYRINLLDRIGPERLAWLEGPHEPRKYTIPELQAIIKTCRAKRRELERAMA